MSDGSMTKKQQALESVRALSDDALCLGLIETARRADQRPDTEGYAIFLLAAADRISNTTPSN